QLCQYVEDLKDLVNDAWIRCLQDYFQLVTVRLMNPAKTQSYIDSCLNDSVEFNTLTRQVYRTDFQNKQVWRAWHYIRELVIKYRRETDIRIPRLEQGAKRNARVKLGQL